MRYERPDTTRLFIMNHLHILPSVTALKIDNWQENTCDGDLFSVFQFADFFCRQEKNIPKKLGKFMYVWWLFLISGFFMVSVLDKEMQRGNYTSEMSFKKLPLRMTKKLRIVATKNFMFLKLEEKNYSGLVLL